MIFRFKEVLGLFQLKFLQCLTYEGLCEGGDDSQMIIQSLTFRI